MMKGVLCTTASALFVAVSGHGNMIQPRPRSSHNQVLDARNQVRPGGTFCCAPRAISRQVILLRASSRRASLESQCHASSSPAPSAVRPAAPPISLISAAAKVPPAAAIRTRALLASTVEEVALAKLACSTRSAASRAAEHAPTAARRSTPLQPTSRRLGAASLPRLPSEAATPRRSTLSARTTSTTRRMSVTGRNGIHGARQGLQGRETPRSRRAASTPARSLRSQTRRARTRVTHRAERTDVFCRHFQRGASRRGRRGPWSKPAGASMRTTAEATLTVSAR